MKANKFTGVATFVISAFLLVSVFGSLAKPVSASCVCQYTVNKAGIVAADPTTTGDLVQIEDGGQTCLELYAKAVGAGATLPNSCDVNKAVLDVGWQIPTFSQLIGNVIRLIFFVAGLFALVFLLLGGFEWVQSGGEEKKIEAARGKITASVIGLVVMIAVLSLVIFLEQVVFGGKICLGISCPMNIGFLQLIR